MERNEEKKPSYTSSSSKIPRRKLKDLKELNNEIYVKNKKLKTLEDEKNIPCSWTGRINAL